MCAVWKGWKALGSTGVGAILLFFPTRQTHWQILQHSVTGSSSNSGTSSKSISLGGMNALVKTPDFKVLGRFSGRQGSGSKLTTKNGGLKLIKDIRLQQLLHIIFDNMKRIKRNWLLGGGSPQPFKLWKWIRRFLRFGDAKCCTKRTCLKMWYRYEIYHFNGNMMIKIDKASSLEVPHFQTNPNGGFAKRVTTRTKDTAPLLAVEQYDSSRNLMYFSLVWAWGCLQSALVARFFMFRKQCW